MLHTEGPIEPLVREAERLQLTTLRYALNVLRHGWDLRTAGVPTSDQHLNAELRALRHQLVERDLYELLYGPLPAHAADPHSRVDPFAEVGAVDGQATPARTQ